MTNKTTTTLDVERVWELYQLKGMTIKVVAKTLGTDEQNVKAALTTRARRLRDESKKEVAKAMIVRSEMEIFDKRFPDLNGAERAVAKEAWLARSEIKSRADLSRYL